MNLIAIDTEFSSFESPVLLSIGLVTVDRDLYCELCINSDGFADLRQKCSGFVKEVVLPQFAMVPNSAYFTTEEIGNAIANWLLANHPSDEILIAFDSQHDWDLLVQTLREGSTPLCLKALSMLRPANVGEATSVAVAQMAMADFFDEGRATSNPLREHHALMDARALWVSLQALGFRRK